MNNIIIGIGGTGGKVIKALRSRIQQTRGEDSNSYLCLDTMGYGYFLQEVYGDKAHQQRLGAGEDLSADMSATELSRVLQKLTGNEGLAINQDEYLKFKGLDSRILGDLLNDPYAHDGMYNWLRAQDFKTVFGVSDKVFQFTEGAGQYRQIGRVGCFSTAAEIQRRLAAIEQKTRVSGDKGSRSVYLVCSLAGGTGSGNFIDLGVLARSIFSNARSQAQQGNDQGSADNINLLLLMNGAFGSTVTSGGSDTDMDVIAHSVLRELGRLQLAPLPKSQWMFRYPEVGVVSIENQQIFDQVCLMDFAAEGKNANESFRQETVYPGMAEMIDLLTAPGTGAKVNVSLINQNSRIRRAQASADNADPTVAEAWQGDRFSPFFSTFNSWRILFPRLAYQRKAGARAVLRLIEELLGTKITEVNNKHLQQAYAIVSNWPALKSLLLAPLFGKATEIDFTLTERDRAPNPEETPATRYLERSDHESQLNLFMGQPLQDLTRAFEGEVTRYYRDQALGGEWLLPKANRDVNLREDLKRELNQQRETHFNVRSLDDMGTNPPKLSESGGVQKAIRRVIDERQAALIKNIDDALIEILQRDEAQTIPTALWVFRMIDSVYLQALLDHNAKRAQLARNETRQVQTNTSRQLTELEGVNKKGGEYKEKSEEYLQQEKNLFNVHFKTLLNEAQLELVGFARHRVRQWINQMDSLVSQLLLEERDSSARRLATGVINSVNSRLEAWAKSDNVSLGLPGHLVNEMDTTMGGFEEHLCAKVVEQALDVQLVSWQLNSSIEEPQLDMLYGEEAEAEKVDYHGGHAFAQLSERVKKPIAEEFNAWSLYKYIGEYVCKNDPEQIELAAQQLVSKLHGMQGSINVTDGDKKIVTEHYITCFAPDSETRTETARLLMQKFAEKAGKLPLDYTAIETLEAEDEFGLVRLDSGLTTNSVGRLKSSRDKYLQYIQADSSILPLIHTLTEEAYMSVREREMHQQLGQGTQRTLPNAICQIFANQHLMELFLGLFYTGFIFPVGNDVGQLGPHYWCYADFSRLKSLVDGSLDDRRVFVKQLRSEPAQYYRELFDLNEKVADKQAGNLISHRKVEDKPDFFTAMVRFVQRMDNGDPRHAQKKFPFTMSQVQSLNSSLKSFWSKKDANGSRLIEVIVDKLKHWPIYAKRLEDIADREWEGKVVASLVIDDFEKKLGIRINASPLTKPEAVEFLHQIGLFLEKYYHKVRPIDDIEEQWV